MTSVHGIEVRELPPDIELLTPEEQNQHAREVRLAYERGRSLTLEALMLGALSGAVMGALIGLSMGWWLWHR